MSSQKTRKKPKLRKPVAPPMKVERPQKGKLSYTRKHKHPIPTADALGNY